MTIKVKITHATGINKISMPSVQSKRSKLAKIGGGSHLGSYHHKRSNSSHHLYNFAHELNLYFCSLINYSSMAPTFHRTDLTKRRMLSTLISRFIPFSLKTNTSSTLEPTCWPSSDNLIKHKINHHHHVTAIFKHFNSRFSNFGTSKLIRNFRQVIPNNICCSWQKTMLINFCLIGVVNSPCKKKQQLRKRSWLLHFING